MDHKHEGTTNKKHEQMEQFRRENTGKPMTDINGNKVANDQKTLRAGKRGPLLMQDFHFYKKQSHFNRERIPEKVVHARGYGVHGEFVATESMKDYTMAKFLEPGTKTPVFVRFSNFQGNKGSKDTAVDIRGFATKFYTEEGNYDMLALQFPVFILADAMKFMDVTHAAKPEPRQHMPQATTAHDNFWDYVTSNPESAHMVMWLMSMRGRPRSWRMMEGFPVNTFRLVNEKGKSTFVRFIWKPKLGVHSITLDEGNMIGGVDPDFHRRDIIEAIESGAYPEYDLCVQLIDEEDEFKFDFDILDDTKLWPEEEVPPKVVGKMVLNRLQDNFFAETEQSAFNPANLVPGIEFTNDPVLQGRSFAYRDTELHRHHSANYEELPINRPISDVNHNLRDSYLKYPIEQDNVHFHNNMQADNTPHETPAPEGYENYPEKVEGHVTREHPSDSFQDYYSQPRMFWNSLSMPEKQDLIESFSFHVGGVKNKELRQKTVEMFANVDTEMATMLAQNVGATPPKTKHVDYEKSFPSLSQLNSPHSAMTSRVAVVIGDGFDEQEVDKALAALKGVGAVIDIISETLAPVTGNNGMELTPTNSFLTVHPTLYDSVYLVGGKAKMNQLKFDQGAMDFFKMHYMFMKPIAVGAGAAQYAMSTEANNLDGVVMAENNPEFADQYIEALAMKRFWDRT